MPCNVPDGSGSTAWKYFNCETPEQARKMNLCWVGDTDALMSRDRSRIEKAVQELKRAGWNESLDGGNIQMRFKVIYRSVQDGSVCCRTVEAASKSSAWQGVEDNGGKVLLLSPKTWWLSNAVARLLRGEKVFRFGVAPDELLVFCELLKVLYVCGVTIPMAISIICDEMQNPWFVKRLSIVLDRISTGARLATAMGDRRCWRAFPARMRETIEEGEVKGDLISGLSRLAEHYRQKSEKHDVVAAHLIPGFGPVFSVACIACLCVVVKVPVLIEQMVGSPDVFQKCIRWFPPVIRTLMFFHNHPLYLLLVPASGLLFCALWAGGRHLRMIRGFFSHIARGLPIIGNMKAKLLLSRFLDGLSLRCETGMLLPDALQLVQRNMNDVIFEDAMSRLQERMRVTGESLSVAMNSEPIFPLIVRQMIREGEERGHLEEVLKTLAIIYQTQAMRLLKRALYVGTLGIVILTVWGGIVLSVAMVKVLMLSHFPDS